MNKRVLEIASRFADDIPFRTTTVVIMAVIIASLGGVYKVTAQVPPSPDTDNVYVAYETLEPSQVIEEALGVSTFDSLSAGLREMALTEEMATMFGMDAPQDKVDYVMRKMASDEELAALVYAVGENEQLDAESRLQVAVLAASDTAARGFVQGIAGNYPAAVGEPYTSRIGEGTIPLLFQWDPRWGYTQYSGTLFGLAGCCPTALSMVYMGLTGDASMTPYELARMAYEQGYVTDKEGTLTIFLPDVASQLGLYCEEFMPDEGELLRLCKQGVPVILNVGPGDFTDGGHFIVAYGVTSDGHIRINDPFSSVHSNQSWDCATLIQQTMGMYAFTY